MMQLQYTENKELPALTWIAHVKGDTVAVQHGCKIETKKTFFVEGVWGGYFLNADFDTAEWFCGTGCVIRDNKAIFASPTGMHAAIYCVKANGALVISNSLPCLMASEGYIFDPKWIGYETFFNHNILQGIYKYKSSVHTLKDGIPNDSIQMVMFRNIVIDRTGEYMIAIKPETKGFESFDEYYNRLKATMLATVENARDTNRKVKYQVTSYISSGYDSATCAAIAKDCGAQKVLTFKAKGKYANDSGVGAAKRLGYTEIIERDAYSYKTRGDFPETQSIASGDIGTEISFSTFEQDSRDHLVFSGQNGDFVWAREKGIQNINDEYHHVWKTSEIGLGESHLHQEYIPVPMASFGIRHWTDLYRISNSDEMKKWSIGGDYDRPIPRRILEERGLPRESFGMKKYGAGFFYAYDWKKRVLGRMSKRSAEDFERYVLENRSNANLTDYTRFLWVNKGFFFNLLMSGLHLPVRIKVDPSKIEYRNSIPNPFGARYVIPWGGNHMIEEYKKQLK